LPTTFSGLASFPVLVAATSSGIENFTTFEGPPSASRSSPRGVETEAETLTLQELGVKLGHGFLFARPAPASG
jgi:hypothetical protein